MMIAGVPDTSPAIAALAQGDERQRPRGSGAVITASGCAETICSACAVTEISVRA